MRKIVLATNNAGKAREFGQLLQNFGCEVVSQKEFFAGDVEETGLTFVENALIKARAACEASGLPSIADDSGLEVDALQGAPGIYSARYAGINATDATNVSKLLSDLQDVPTVRRTARFVCVIVYLRHAKDPVPLISLGTWNGILLTAPQGENGFGYDPVFFVPEQQCSAAQLSAEVKNSMSHRGQALRQFLAQFQTSFLANG